MREGSSEKAIPHLEYMIQKLPTHVAAHALLAQAYTNERRFEEAKIAWQDALFLMPNSPSIKKGFRRVLKELAKQSLAGPTLQSAIPLAKAHPAPVPEEAPGELFDSEGPTSEQKLETPQEKEEAFHALPEEETIPSNEVQAQPVEATSQQEENQAEESLTESSLSALPPFGDELDTEFDTEPEPETDLHPNPRLNLNSIRNPNPRLNLNLNSIRNPNPRLNLNR